MSSICLYAHKGGVGKSTLTLELATIITKKTNKSVIIIDADTQLNTTFNLLSRNYKDNILDNFIDTLLSQTPDNLKININGKEVSTLYSYLHTVNYEFNDNDFITLNNNNKIKFLIGSPILHTLELQLINSINKLIPALNSLPLSFKKLMDSIKIKYQNEVVILVDLSPSSSIINQNLLLSCDYLIIPNTPDSNSMLSLKLLYKYLDEWRQYHDYLTHNIKFLCTILNKYKVANGMAKMDYDFFRKIREYTEDFLETKSNKKYLIDNHDNMCLVIQDGMRYSKACSKLHISSYELTKEIINRNCGPYDEGKLDSMKAELNELFNYINTNVIE